MRESKANTLKHYATDIYSGYTFLAMYIVAPEKFVALVLFYSLKSPPILCGNMLVTVFGGALLDLCGLAALGAGLGAGNSPLALAVGYSATALGALFLVVSYASSPSGVEQKRAMFATVCCVLPAAVVPYCATKFWV
eukprot:COSAG02_NODE_14407_length_1276_cov_0.753611_1_plen_137_part_00